MPLTEQERREELRQPPGVLAEIHTHFLYLRFNRRRDPDPYTLRKRAVNTRSGLITAQFGISQGVAGVIAACYHRAISAPYRHQIRAHLEDCYFYLNNASRLDFSPEAAAAVTTPDLWIEPHQQDQAIHRLALPWSVMFDTSVEDLLETFAHKAAAIQTAQPLLFNESGPDSVDWLQVESALKTHYTLLQPYILQIQNSHLSK